MIQALRSERAALERVLDASADGSVIGRALYRLGAPCDLEEVARRARVELSYVNAAIARRIA